MEIRRVQSVGNTFYATIPKHWISNLGLCARDYIVLSRVEGGIFIEPLKDNLKKKQLETEEKLTK